MPATQFPLLLIYINMALFVTIRDSLIYYPVHKVLDLSFHFHYEILS